MAVEWIPIIPGSVITLTLRSIMPAQRHSPVSHPLATAQTPGVPGPGSVPVYSALRTLPSGATNWSELLSQWGTFGAALFAALGLLLAGRQLKIQNRQDKLQQLDTVDVAWKRWREHIDPSNTVVDQSELLPQILEFYRSVMPPGERPLLPCGPKPEFTGTYLREAPWVVEVFLPTLPLESPPPVAEAQYRVLLLYRARLCGNQFQSADSLGTLSHLNEAMRGYLNHINDLAEKFESGVIDRVAFMSKFHVNLVQAAFHWEPYILWFNYREKNARHFMRVLSLGAAARDYHWMSSIQHQPLSSRRDLGYILAHSSDYADTKVTGKRLAMQFTPESKREWNELCSQLRQEFAAGNSSFEASLITESARALRTGAT